jgi:hypothetical protein
MVLCWMMMPRAGGRDFKFVVKTMDQIFQRNIDAWATDHRTFTHAPVKRATPSKKKSVKKTTKKPAKTPKKRPRR